MKKWIGLAVVLILMMVLTGCGNSGRSGAAHKAGGSKSVNDVLNEGVKKEDEKNNGQTGNQTVTGDPSQSGDSGNGSNPATPKTEGVDIDLTTMSSTMVYSEVNNIVNEPEKYIGKTIKMNGVYAFVYDDSYTKRYDACIIQDATACCASGIEFRTAKDLVYPDEIILTPEE